MIKHNPYFNNNVTSLVAQMIKRLPTMQETQVRSLGWEDRSSGEGNGNPLQYSCLENPTDREMWQATVHGVAKSRTRLSDYTFTFHLIILLFFQQRWVYLGSTENCNSNGLQPGPAMCKSLSSIGRTMLLQRETGSWDGHGKQRFYDFSLAESL